MRKAIKKPGQAWVLQTPPDGFEPSTGCLEGDYRGLVVSGSLGSQGQQDAHRRAQKRGNTPRPVRAGLTPATDCLRPGRPRLAEAGARAKALRQQAMSQGQAGVSQRIEGVVPAGFLT
jgi:hypothetical protein